MIRAVALVCLVASPVAGLLPHHRLSFNPVRTCLTSTAAPTENVPMLDDIADDFKPLLAAAINATALREADESNQGHDSFRYEWGTWCVMESLQWLMERVDQVRVNKDVYEDLVQDETTPRRLRIADGQDWDMLLHVLPPQTEWTGRWPTGSWAVVKTLTGMAEIAALTEDRNGNWKEKTKRELRGGSDGSLGAGQSSAGEDCIKYVGGPLRRYRGKFGKTVLLEVIVRPPIGRENQEDIEPLHRELHDTLSIFVEPEETESKVETVSPKELLQGAKNSSSLGFKMGMTFDAVGGLDDQLEAIARRVLASRANPEAARRLGVSHVRGILLSGPPGCGKTLLARELARTLGAREPQIVNG